MKKRRSLYNLIQLYLSYHFNKTVMILLGLVLLLWCVVLILNTGIPLDSASYLNEYRSYHQSYLEQSIFFLQLIDGVIVSFLIGAEITSLSLFDPMFVPNTSRIKIVFSKLFVNFFILFWILLFQILLLELIGTIIYSNFVVRIEDFYYMFYLLLPLIELLFLGEFISMILNSYFIPILIFILHIVSIILLKTDKISKILFYFLPKIGVLSEKIIIEWNAFLYFGICFLLGLGIALVFEKKDIST